MKARACRRIASGQYVYRGLRIELVDDCGYRAWNIFNGEDIVDTVDTLAGAKRYIDIHLQVAKYKR